MIPENDSPLLKVVRSMSPTLVPSRFLGSKRRFRAPVGSSRAICVLPTSATGSLHVSAREAGGSCIKISRFPGLKFRSLQGWMPTATYLCQVEVAKGAVTNTAWADPEEDRASVQGPFASSQRTFSGVCGPGTLEKGIASSNVASSAANWKPCRSAVSESLRMNQKSPIVDCGRGRSIAS